MKIFTGETHEIFSTFFTTYIEFTYRKPKTYINRIFIAENDRLKSFSFSLGINLEIEY
jgi:hypothetical protein